MSSPPDDIDHVDRHALERCIAIARRDPLMVERIEAADDWMDAAQLSAYHCQTVSLHLRPWEEPPAVAHETGVDRDPNAQALLRRMLAAGLSRYEPDPLAARAQQNISQRRRCVRAPS
jgi:hypothetical protein